MTAADPRADQLDAAAADQRRQVLDDAAARNRVVVSRPGGLTLDVLTRFVQSIQGPPLLICEHAEHGPAPVVGFAGAPAAIFCRTCAEHVADDIPDRACDGCATDDVPTLAASAIHGVLELRIRLCRHCAGTAVHPCHR